MNNRRFKYGVLAVVITVLVAVFAVGVNVLASLLSDRLGLSVDLTASRAFSVSENVVEAFESIDVPVRVTVLYERTEFAESSPYFAQVCTILERAEKVNDNIEVRYISPISEPSIKSEYPELSVREGDIIIHNLSSGRANEIGIDTLFTMSSDGASIVSSQAEEVLASSLLAMTGDNAAGVAFTSGHGEAAHADLGALLTLNNYAVSEVGTLVEEIPNDVKVLFINEPTADFTEAEIGKLEDFLYNGGEYGTSIVYFASVGQPELTALEEFLQSYGIEVTDSYVRESDPNHIVSEMDGATVVRYLDDAVCGGAAAKSGYSISAFTRSLHILYAQSGSVSVVPVLGFFDTAYEYPVAGADEGFEAELRGDLCAAARARISVLEDGVPKSSNLVVFGSELFVYDGGFLTTEGINNAEVMVGLMDFIAPSSISISASPKTLGGSPISLSQGDARTIGAVFMAVIPALVLAAGVTVFIRRRNR